MTSNASGVSASFAAPMSTIQCSFSICGYSAAISSKTLWNRPSVCFMMLSFVKQVTFFRLFLHRVLERVADDLLAARARDQLEALNDLRALLILDAGVEVLLVLADDDHVHLRVLGLDVRMVGDARPDVGVEAERLAGGDVEALVAAALRRGDGRFEKHLGAAQRLPRFRVDARGVAATGTPFRRSRSFRCRGALRLPSGSAASPSMISGPMPSPCATVMGRFAIHISPALCGLTETGDFIRILATGWQAACRSRMRGRRAQRRNARSRSFCREASEFLNRSWQRA